jgi:hypothetical protein
MAVVLDATVGGATSNSYETIEEAQAYYDTRTPVAGWDNAADQAILLMMGTRVLEAMSRPMKSLVTKDGQALYYITRRTWTGQPATTTQKLAWPRTGMYDANGNAIPDDVIPQDLKDALAELAGALGTSDSTLDNDVKVQGLTSVRAGSVSLTFKDMIEQHVIPDFVWSLMPPSWFTDETVSYDAGNLALFDVVSE